MNTNRYTATNHFNDRLQERFSMPKGAVSMMLKEMVPYLGELSREERYIHFFWPRLNMIVVASEEKEGLVTCYHHPAMIEKKWNSFMMKDYLFSSKWAKYGKFDQDSYYTKKLSKVRLGMGLDKKVGATSFAYHNG